MQIQIDLMLCTTPTCFSTFFWSTMVPTLVEKIPNFKLSLETPLLLLWLKYNIAVHPYYFWWTHTYCIKTMEPRTLVISIIVWKEDQLCSTRYIAVRINNCLKITSAIKVIPMKITDNFRYKWKPSRAYQKNQHFSQWAKMNGTQRHCMHSSMAKGTSSQAEVMSKSKKSSP